MVIRKAALPINKPCPDCGQVGGLSLTLGLAAQLLGSFSIAGAQDKVVARQVAVLACSQCRGSRTGHLEGVETGPDGVVTAGHFVEDSITLPG